MPGNKPRSNNNSNGNNSNLRSHESYEVSGHIKGDRYNRQDNVYMKNYNNSSNTATTSTTTNSNRYESQLQHHQQQNEQHFQNYTSSHYHGYNSNNYNQVQYTPSYQKNQTNKSMPRRKNVQNNNNVHPTEIPSDDNEKKDSKQLINKESDKSSTDSDSSKEDSDGHSSPDTSNPQRDAPNSIRRRPRYNKEYFESPFPWMSKMTNIDSDPQKMLSDEIIAFTEYMGPTAEEKKMRNLILNKIKEVILKAFPTAEVKVFGSFVTNLYLPSSDIDMVVLEENFSSHELIGKIASELYQVDFYGAMKVLDRAKVPIIKFQDNIVKYEIDISFNILSGVRADEIVKEKIEEFPLLRPLSFVIKQLLHQNRLNEVFSGGLSSYSIVLLIVSFLQMRKQQKTEEEEVNLGTLLVEFLKLYGKDFNYVDHKISVRGKGEYLPKTIGSGVFQLSIEDPTDIEKDVAFRSFNIAFIQRCFHVCHDALEKQLSEATLIPGVRDSILGKIIWITNHTQSKRSHVARSSRNF